MITEGAESVEDRYGFSKDALKTAERKVTAPRVEISFDSTNPAVGEKVTAHALPEFFKNDTKNLYYTWYLIHTTKDGTSKAERPTPSNPGKKRPPRSWQEVINDHSPDCSMVQAIAHAGTVPEASANNDPDSDGWPSTDGTL